MLGALAGRVNAHYLKFTHPRIKSSTLHLTRGEPDRHRGGCGSTLTVMLHRRAQNLFRKPSLQISRDADLGRRTSRLKIYIKRPINHEGYFRDFRFRSCETRQSQTGLLEDPELKKVPEKRDGSQLIRAERDDQ